MQTKEKVVISCILYDLIPKKKVLYNTSSGGEVLAWNSWMTHLVFLESGHLCRKTRFFLVPITSFVPLRLILRTLPVTFQFPFLVVLLTRLLFGNLQSCRQKKYHTRSFDWITARSTNTWSHKKKTLGFIKKVWI